MHDLLFDLDGTLVNSKEGIVKSVYYALHALDIEESEPEKLERFIGPPLEESFREFYQLNDTGVRKAVELYRERYKKKGVYECSLYPGIDAALQALHEQGKRICLATSKPQVFAEQILDMHHVRQYFQCIVGATLDSSMIHKADIIREVMRQLPVATPDQLVMIGDRRYDIEGAKACGIKSIGVEYGFAEQNELQDAGADYIVPDVPALLSLLQGDSAT